MNSTLIDQARLVSAGWEQTRSNRWAHSSFMVSANRPRLFSFEAALALLDASESVTASDKVLG